jgi:hypothetical protein
MNFTDDRHALYAGWVIGTAMRHGVQLEPIVDDDGNYTDQLRLVHAGLDITLIVPPPPDDWKFPDG